MGFGCFAVWFGLLVAFFFYTDKSCFVLKWKIQVSFTQYPAYSYQILFYGPQKPHRSVVSLLQEGCIQHWLGQQNLAFRFHVSGQRTFSSSSVKFPLFTDCYQHIPSEGIHTNSACSSLFYTSCIYFKHSPHWNLWPVTGQCACADAIEDFAIPTSIKDIQIAQEELRIVKEVVLKIEIKLLIKYKIHIETIYLNKSYLLNCFLLCSLGTFVW